MLMSRSLRFAIFLAISFVSIYSISFAEKSQQNPQKKYYYKFTQTIKLPKWAMFGMKDTSYTLEWEGSMAPYCSGQANGCYGSLVVTITSEAQKYRPDSTLVEPSDFDQDSTLIFGDDYLQGIDSGATIMLIRFADDSHGRYGDIFDITERTLLPLTVQEESDSTHFQRNISTPVLFPTQKAKYSPDLDAFVAYYYKLSPSN